MGTTSLKKKKKTTMPEISPEESELTVPLTQVPGSWAIRRSPSEQGHSARFNSDETLEDLRKMEHL